MTNKNYIVKMNGAYAKDNRSLTIEASSLDEAAAKFHAMRDRKWMSACIRMEGSTAVYPVDSLPRRGWAHKQAMKS